MVCCFGIIKSRVRLFPTVLLVFSFRKLTSFANSVWTNSCCRLYAPPRCYCQRWIYKHTLLYVRSVLQQLVTMYMHIHFLLFHSSYNLCSHSFPSIPSTLLPLSSPSHTRSNSPHHITYALSVLSFFLPLLLSFSGLFTIGTLSHLSLFLFTSLFPFPLSLMFSRFLHTYHGHLLH